MHGAAYRRRLSRQGGDLLYLPAALIAVVVALPLVYLGIRASEAGTDVFDLLWRERTARILRNSIVLAATVTLASVAISLPLAWLQTRSDIPLRRFWMVTTVLPLAVPSYVGAYTVIAALGPRGLLQGWLEGPFGIQRLPEIYGWFGAWLTLTLFTYPYLLLTLRTALVNLDASLEEAARSSGYGPWATFAFVTLPQLRPALATGSLLVALYVLSDFGAVSLLQYDVFTRAIYNQYRSAFDRTLAAGLSLVLVVLIFLILALEAWLRGKRAYHRATSGATRPQRRVALGRWTLPALLGSATVVLLALVMPLGVISYWLVRGVRAGQSLGFVWDAARNTAYVSLLAALVAVVAAAPLAILSTRRPSRATSLIEKITYIGYALPGIVVGLSLVFFGARYLPRLYQTLAILVVAYVIRFLPEALGALRVALLQVSPRVEEAARGLGYSRLRVWLTVTTPLARAGVLSGAALVFLTVAKELPATMLLRPTGFDTLALSIWSATSEGFWARGALPALLLIVVAAIPLVPLALRDGGDRR
ncbi:MAG: iron ABC transporter permease [Chloroflexi bacterium]|nr:MAG: iron ABC transporter permease [Chloroflexota bacterium]